MKNLARTVLLVLNNIPIRNYETLHYLPAHAWFAGYSVSSASTLESAMMASFDVIIVATVLRITNETLPPPQRQPSPRPAPRP